MDEESREMEQGGKAASDEVNMGGYFNSAEFYFHGHVEPLSGVRYCSRYQSISSTISPCPIRRLLHDLTSYHEMVF